MKKIINTILLLFIVIGTSINASSTKQIFFKDSIIYKSSNGELYSGTITEFYNTQNLKSEINIKKGKRNGVSKWFYQNGNLKFKFNYDDGKLTGVQQKYYNNGNLNYEQIYNNGRLELEKWFYQNGKLKNSQNYKNFN